MKSFLRRRPSPALVISLIALFVSLGGVSYGVATGSIDSRELKNNDVRTKDLRNNDVRTRDVRNNEVRGIDIRRSTIRGSDVGLNTLTGEDVRENSLGKVPSAAAADTAASAASAGSANSAATVGGFGVRKLFAKQAPGTAATEVLRGDGFALLAGCQAGSAILRISGIAGAPGTNVAFQGSGPDTADAGTEPDVVFDSDGDLTAADGFDLLGGNDRGAGTAVVSTTAGRVTTISYAASRPNGFPGENVCSLRGTVVSG